jgi:hypothetical protein
VLITKAGNIRTLTPQKIGKLTLGQLAEVFAQIQNQNYSDVTILTRLNRDRVGVVHNKGEGGNRSRLRKNVGQHMWSVVTVLKELLGAK